MLFEVKEGTEKTQQQQHQQQKKQTKEEEEKINIMATHAFG